MHTFFHGWRRKAGVVTLVMACAAVLMWFRSQVVEDYFEVAYWIVYSQDGSVSCRFNIFLARPPYWESHPLSPSSEVFGIHYRFKIQYMSLVLFFAVLSAYLILWKPRKRADSRKSAMRAGSESD